MAFKSNKTNQTLNFKVESISLVKRIVSITNSVKCFAFARHSCREKRGISPCMQPNFIKRLASTVYYKGDPHGNYDNPSFSSLFSGIC
jgi:hypothetical protein